MVGPIQQSPVHLHRVRLPIGGSTSAIACSDTGAIYAESDEGTGDADLLVSFDPDGNEVWIRRFP